MSVQSTSVERWPTEQLLTEFERLFGRLEKKTRRRIVERARVHGWERNRQRAAHQKSLALVA